MPTRLKWGMWRFHRARIDLISDPLTHEGCHEIIATVAFRAKHTRHRFGDGSEHRVMMIDAVEATIHRTAADGVVAGRETKTSLFTTIEAESTINSLRILRWSTGRLLSPVTLSE